MEEKTIHRVLSVENLTPETYILRLERNGFQFEAGQYVVIRDPERKESREYSVFSGTHAPYLEFLIREVSEGFSRYLRHLLPGTELQLEGPKGFFLLDEATRQGSPVTFIATGTGISPFHSFIQSYHGLDYRIIHGVRFTDEAYGKKAFDKRRYTLCTSRVDSGNYFGRVNQYLKQYPIESSGIFYLCGNSEMINEVTNQLEQAGVLPENIRTEVFF